jgi:hypothetical protein
MGAAPVHAARACLDRVPPGWPSIDVSTWAFAGSGGAALTTRRPRRYDPPSSSKTRRWSGVGVVTFLNEGAPGPAGWTVFTQSVPRSSSRLSKLCTGAPSSVRLVAAFASAFTERSAGATGLVRAARAAALSSSLSSTGARAEELVAQRRVGVAKLGALQLDRAQSGLQRAGLPPAVAVAFGGTRRSVPRSAPRRARRRRLLRRHSGT